MPNPMAVLDFYECALLLTAAAAAAASAGREGKQLHPPL